MANTHSIDLELGSNQYLSIADASQTGLDLTTDFSLEAWVKVESIGANMLVVGKQDRNDYAGYSMAIDVGGEVTVFFGDTGARSRRTTTSAVFTAANTAGNASWVHLAGTVDISANDIQIYVNGSVVSMQDVVGTNTVLADAGAVFMIGAEDFGATFSYPFDGLIDEVRVWSDVRTSGEISANYQTELVGNEANLVAYWKLNNGLLDETANNNDLTNNNSAVFSTDVPFTGVVGPANLKTLNTVATASIKTINGVAMASVKTWNTVT